MTIEIQGHGSCRVTKHALHDLDISVRTYREGCRGVPQTMQDQPLNADLGEPLPEDFDAAPDESALSYCFY